MSQPVLTNSEYVAKLGIECPFCTSTEICGGEINIDAGCASQEVHCQSCNAEWQDVYNLTGYDHARRT